MKHRSNQPVNRVRRLRIALRRRRLLLSSLAILLGSWLLINTLILSSRASAPVDAFLVLGGSISRERHVAELAKQQPETRILISQGSLEPCIWQIFQRQQAPIGQVWLEKCAQSTFDNFYFAIPILREWGVHKVKLITSDTHLPRALYVGKILLGAHGIWVEPDIVEEQGIPGNQESYLKTGVDVTRSLVWAVISQFYWPKCSALTPLADVNINDWLKQGFKCEYQANLNS